MAYAAHTLPGQGPRRRPRARSKLLAAREAHYRFDGIVLAMATLMNIPLAMITAIAARLTYLRPLKLKVGFTWSLFAVIGVSLLTSFRQGFSARFLGDMRVGASFGSEIVSLKAAALLGMVTGYPRTRPLALLPVGKPTRSRAVMRELQA